MKIRILFLSCLLLCLAGCSDDENIGPDKPQEQEEVEINQMEAFIPLKSKSSSNKTDLLGKGYDFTGSYLNDTSTKKAVIDVEKYLTDHPGSLKLDGATQSSDYFIAGADAWEYTKKLTNISNDNYWNPISDSISAFSGFILDNEMLYKEAEENLNDFSFASTHYYHHTYYHGLNALPMLLYDYLTEEFKIDLASLAAEKIIEKYGTHVIRAYTTGLRLDLIYRSKVNRHITSDFEYSDYSIEEFVKAGLRHTINQTGNWINGELNPPSDDDVKRNGVPILYIENHGGDNSLIPSGVYNLQKGYPKIDINEWLKSGTTENSAFVDLQLENTFPIYELIADEAKKAELKEATDTYIKERQINL